MSRKGVKRETYRTAPISLATAAACWYAIGFILRSRRRLIVSGSSRKSSLVPTRMMGMLGAWWQISGYH